MSTYSAPSEEFIFIVDTEQYSGNFEREMCAYMTGCIGHCGAGGEEQQIFNEEMGIDTEQGELDHPFHFVTGRSDDHGCFRPCTIWPTPGYFNHGMGGHFKEGQEEEAKKHYENECDKEIAKPHSDKNMWEERKQGELRRYPAYQSVAIFMNRPPTAEEIGILMERAKKFAEYMKNFEGWNKQKITITGFRFIKEETRHEICGQYSLEKVNEDEEN